nr:hypothetical protein [Tanacetum cinerariifolium]
MVAYLSKSDASEGFNQILDFLNGSSIKYALTVNPNIYVSCIKQFWNTVVVKQVNDVTRLQVLVDKKKVVVTEDAIREGMLVDQEVDKEGDAKGHVEEVNAGDAAQGDDSAAHGERVGTSQRIDTSDDTVMDDESKQGRMIAEIDRDDAIVLMDDKEEVTAASDLVTVASTIIAAAAQVPAATLTAAPTKEQIKEEENRALQKINETPAERASKRRKLDEEVEDLKRHLEIMPNEDD